MKRRAIIVYDGKAYHVRRLYSATQDLTRDVVVYECDRPIANDFTALSAACVAMTQYLRHGGVRADKPAPSSDRAAQGEEQHGSE